MNRSVKAMLLSKVNVGPWNISRNWSSPCSNTDRALVTIFTSFKTILRKGVFWLPLYPQRFSFIEISTWWIAGCPRLTALCPTLATAQKRPLATVDGGGGGGCRVPQEQVGRVWVVRDGILLVQEYRNKEEIQWHDTWHYSPPTINSPPRREGRTSFTPKRRIVGSPVVPSIASSDSICWNATLNSHPQEGVYSKNPLTDQMVSPPASPISDPSRTVLKISQPKKERGGYCLLLHLFPGWVYLNPLQNSTLHSDLQVFLSHARDAREEKLYSMFFPRELVFFWGL